MFQIANVRIPLRFGNRFEDKNSEESCYLFDDSNIRQRVSTSAIAIWRTLFINLVNIVNIIKFSALSLDKPLGITYD